MFGDVGIWQLLIILVIIIALFGTKKLRNLGGDLGSAMKGFKDAMKDGERQETNKQLDSHEQTPADDSVQAKQTETPKQEDKS